MKRAFKRDSLQKYLAGLFTACGADDGLLRADAHRNDLNESLAFARELEHFIGTIYDLEFVDLTSMTMFPADPTTADPADLSYTVRKMGGAGRAEFISNWTTSLPAVSYDSKGENNYPIKSFGNMYAVSVQDMRVSQRLGIGLEQKLAENAKRAHAELWEEVAFFGDTASGVKGLFSSAEFVANNTAKVGVAWDTNPANLVDIVLNDVANMWNKIEIDTGRRYTPDTLAVSSEAMSILTTPRPLGTAGMYGSIEQIIRTTYGPRGLKEIVYARPLNNVPTYGPVVMLYKKDARVLAHQTPIFFEQFLPQQQGLAVIVPCHSRLGGVHVETPKAITYMTGTTT